MNVGLVLSGGVAKGAYQAGFLKAMKEGGVNVTSISCASIGIFGGYAYSADKVDKLVSMWQKIHFDNVFDLAGSVWFRHFLKNELTMMVENEDSLKIPLYAPVCYFPFLHMDYYKMYGDYDKRWYSFIRSAISFPFISGGVRFLKGQVALDGGLMDNIPVQPILFNEKPDVILVLHFAAGYRPRKSHVMCGIPILDFDISIHNMFRKRSFDFHGDTLKSMLDSGYEYGNYICKDLFDGRSIEETLKNSEIIRNKELGLRFDNSTFETWVQRANDLLYPFVKKKGTKIRELVCVKEKKTERKNNVVKEMS